MGRFATPQRPWIYNYIGSNKSLEEISAERGCSINDILQECVHHNIDAKIFHFDPAKHRDISTHWVYQYIRAGKTLQEVAKEQNLTEGEILVALMAIGKQQTDLEAATKRFIGLDVGTSRLLVAHKTDQNTISILTQRNAFLELPNNAPTMRALKRQSVNYVELDNKLFLVGNDAYDFGHVFPHIELKRPMSGGMLSVEPSALPVIKEIIGALIGAADPGSKCAYSIPAPPVDIQKLVQYHTDVIEGIIKLYGYEPIIVNEAVAVANTVSSSFTGLAMSFGGGLINAALLFKGLSALQISVTQAGDFVDGQASKDLGLAPIQINTLKESGEIDVSKTQTTREGQAIKSYIMLTIRHALTELSKYFVLTKDKPHFDTPIPVAIAGGGCLIPGFLSVFKNEIMALDMPFKIDLDKIMIVDDPLTAIARGCLIESELA